MKTSMQFLGLLSLLVISIFVSPVDSADQYVLELHVVVDPAVANNLIKIGLDHGGVKLKLLHDLRFILIELQKYFDTMKLNNLEMQIKVKKLDIVTEEDDWFEYEGKFTYKGNIDDLLKYRDLVLKWLAEQSNCNNPHQGDIVVVFTGNTINSGGTIGFHPEGCGVCSQTCRVVVLTLRDLQRAAYVLAHELGHSFSSNHSESGIMYRSVLDGKKLNRYRFSKDSVDEIMSNINSLEKSGNNCLAHQSTRRYVKTLEIHEVTYVHVELFIPNKICQRLLSSKEARHCKNHRIMKYLTTGNGGDAECRVIMCARSKESACISQTIPTEGIPCGSKKGMRCRRSLCVLGNSFRKKAQQKKKTLEDNSP